MLVCLRAREQDLSHIQKKRSAIQKKHAAISDQLFRALGSAILAVSD